MAHFREVIKNRNFLLLWISQVISQFGDRLTQMALIALVAQRAGSSTFQLAKVMSFTILPVFLIGPIAGVYVDRWDRRYTLITCDILRGIIIFCIPFIFLYWKTLIPIYIIIFLSFCASRFYVPAKMAIVPDLVEEKNLLLANSLVNTTGMIAATVGFGLGGILVEVFGARGGFYIDATTFFLSAALILLFSKVTASFKPRKVLRVGREVIEVIRKSVFTEMKEGIAYLFNSLSMRLVANLMFLLFAAAGAIYVIMIVFVQEALHTVTMDLGFLIMFLGAGLFVGSLVYGKFGERLTQLRAIFFCFGLGGIVLILFAFLVHTFETFIVAAVLAFFLGSVVAPIFTAANTLIHKASDGQMRGKVFSSLEIVMHFAFLLFMLVSSSIAEAVGSFWFLVGIGIVFALVGLIGVVFNRLEVYVHR